MLYLNIESTHLEMRDDSFNMKQIPCHVDVVNTAICRIVEILDAFD